MPIYDDIIAGIDAHRSTTDSLENYLESLQPVVRLMRDAYRRSTVHVEYNKESIQSAYLITYLPHYYQLIKRILRERNPDNLSKNKTVNITFVGGGPGSEAYGAIKHILFHNKVLETINVTILDINADTWGYSHQIVQNQLVERIRKERAVEINWKALQFDLTEPTDVATHQAIFVASHLVVVQNCINEIPHLKFELLASTILSIVNTIPSQGALLMIDLTSSVRDKIRTLQTRVNVLPNVRDIVSTTNNADPAHMYSINGDPTSIIKRHLLNGSSGLIPRKNLKYDYSLISKCIIREQPNQAEAGLGVIYSPLSQVGLENIEEIKNRTFIGLDIGTSITVCTIAKVVDDKIELITIPFEQKGPNGNKLTAPLVPTAIGLYRNNFMLGQFALDLRAFLEPDKNNWFGFKSNLGRLEETVYPDSVLANYATCLIRNAKEGFEVFLTQIRAQIGEFIEQNDLAPKVCFSVSVPVSFPDFKKDELRSCLINSGYNLENVPFTQEPISALIYALYNEEVAFNREEAKNILVLDLGAGTADVSIMNLSADTDNVNAEILSSIRIEERGGDQIDELIFETSCHGIRLSNKSKAITQHQSRELKVKLCKEIQLGADLMLPPKALDANVSCYLALGIPELAELRISFEQFHEIMCEYWTGVAETLESALTEAKLTVDDIDDVILSGGGSRNPYIKSFSRDYFKKSCIIVPDNIQEQVARGNALQGLVLNGLGKNLINSKLPNTIYITTADGEQVLFKKGEIIPSIEVELDVNCVVDAAITIRIENQEKRIHYSIVGTIEKAYLYLTSDQEIKCEILQNGSLILPEKTYIV